jgi:hypothetical protein
MQKQKKASILIWSIFLSLIISISFFSIATKITKNLKSNNNIEENYKKNKTINNILKNFSGSNITKNNLEFFIENSNLQKSLKKYEKIIINFPQSST